MAWKYSKAAQVWNTRDQRVALISTLGGVFANRAITEIRLIESTKICRTASGSVAYHFVTL